MASKKIKVGFESYDISYEILNPKCENAILFLHGWGANKEIMKKAFGAHLTNFCHIYVDMPGFGASSINSPLKTKDYAKIIRAFIAELSTKPAIIAGHSFGGKVATLLEPANLVLLSSAGIVEKKPLSVRFKIAVFKLFKLLGFGKFYRLFASKDVSGMSRTMYETLKNVVDEDFSSKFENFKNKALIFWGKNDRATSLKSGDKIHKFIKNSEFFPLEGDHFFFLLHAKFISQTIEDGMGVDTMVDIDLQEDSGIEEIR
ncbi:alpha/beta fold hydrolase [Campylobacter sp. 7477a]|uniref:alpha/beta fold hydrolase n=1 Tax=Campylobacter sp. 7477a TaxID=2735741 RepID=UPI0030153A61|nr:alpha/beta hydrolase [Campylobacter sp. 7477a]